MEELMMNVNWLAVGVGTLLAYALGWLWYSDTLFGKKWRDGIGVLPTDNSPMMPAVVTQLIGTFLFAWVIGITATTDSLMFAILITLTFVALVKANGFFCQKSKYAIMVEAGYIIAMMILMVIVHALI